MRRLTLAGSEVALKTRQKRIDGEVASIVLAERPIIWHRKRSGMRRVSRSGPASQIQLADYQAFTGIVFQCPSRAQSWP